MMRTILLMSVMLPICVMASEWVESTDTIRFYNKSAVSGRVNTGRWVLDRVTLQILPSVQHADAYSVNTTIDSLSEDE